jgi:transposase
VPEEKETVTYQRKKSRDNAVNDSGLRFDDTVPVETIEVDNPELADVPADLLTFIDEKMTYRLAQRPGSYVVLKYVRKVFKRQDNQTIVVAPAPDNVLDKSIADVSFLAGMLVDKFRYHLPLYRQHQRLAQCGIQLSRTTLTHLTGRAIDLLKPIADTQLGNILLSRVLAMDETPIKAGRKQKGKMRQAYFWPIYNEQDETDFSYSSTRAHSHVPAMLGDDFTGTLLSDGYEAYASYAAQREKVTHAQCWSHTRRYFERAADSEPVAAEQALIIIGKRYEHEAPIRDKQYSPEATLKYRTEHRFIVVKGFLSDPAVPIDTNHLERSLRTIPMGRRNWLFCWTEVGAEKVGIVQSLITTCRLLGVDPYVYLVDVLLRISEHPASRVIELTPRVWKEKFADQPMISDLFRQKTTS